MQSWNNRFEALEISQLRSPAFAHPVAFEPTALVDFAIQEGRTSELSDAPVCCWVPTTDLSAQGRLLKALPSSALFRDFCLTRLRPSCRTVGSPEQLLACART